MTGARIEHSRMGIASFVMSVVPVVLFVGLILLVLLLASRQPPGADETGFAFLVLMLVLMTVLSEVAALGLGVAGARQRRRMRLFAFVGVAFSVLVLVAINTQVEYVDLARLVAGLVEGPPEVHIVSPQNE
jgi:energy-coupling factor transporter transmembrane protein EcfT